MIDTTSYCGYCNVMWSDMDTHECPYQKKNLKKRFHLYKSQNESKNYKSVQGGRVLLCGSEMSVLSEGAPTRPWTKGQSAGAF